ncbi:hypothetical protein K0M31_017277 [Melipona bicolor]|uniref:Uncharacterized protein n=1 Tax=Melipona bicolor TaxID=60889 RepID=A0AA40G4H9_9HYME|nr:hypothetical protein K0M31_017277 [Melipona bicolor]
MLIGNPNWSSPWAFQRGPDGSAGKSRKLRERESRSWAPTPTTEGEARVEDLCRETEGEPPRAGI